MQYPSLPAAENDALDLREIGAALGRGKRWIAAGVVLGALAAALATWVLRSEYEGKAVVLLRNAGDPGSSALSRLGGLAGGLAGSLPLSLESTLDTELKILTSRAVIGEVVDSLGLQVSVAKPDKVGPADLFSEARVEPELPPESRYSFEREGAGYRVSGPGARGAAVPGRPYALPGATLTLRAGALPESFTIELLDRESAISSVFDRLEADNPAGEVAELVYRAGDRRTAAAVPNALVSHYLVRRRTTDRGVNQRRYEFLQAQVDSVAAELTRAEAALRAHQEASGVLDPQLSGAAEMERSTALRKELEGVEVEARALEELVQQTEAGSVSARRLAAYPTFLKNPAINDLLSRLFQLETERQKLGELRTDADEEMIALRRSISYLEDQVNSLSRSYLSGLVRQRTALRAELAGQRAELLALPGQAESSLRLQREVRRLSETSIALQAQLVQARLGTIGEGGDVRQIDAAVPPREPVFPKLWINLAAGLFGGLVLGTVGALSSAYLSPRVREPRDVELAAGVPALALRAGTPLLLGGLDEVRTLLVLPVGAKARAGEAARRIAMAASVRGRSVVLADLEETQPKPLPAGESTANGTAMVPLVSGALLPVPAQDPAGYLLYQAPAGAGAASPQLAREAVAELEQHFSLVVVALPGLDHPAAEALLDEARPVVLAGHSGRLMRAEVSDMVAAFARAGIRTAGVVLQDGEGKRNGARRS